jgi:glycosyltransferase involved in cell wall biosynthesis
MSKELVVVMPVYNEADIIHVVVEDWCQALRELSIDFELRLYNDGSKNDTLNVLQALKSEYLELVVIDKPNSGHGPTIMMGYNKADSQYVFQLDSDNEMKAQYFALFWEQRD